MDYNRLMTVLASFEREELDYALVGGVALNLHGISRTTEDADFFIRPTYENVERLRRALDAVFADPNLAEINAEELVEGTYPSVRYYPPEGDLYFDILTRLGEAVTFDSLEILERDIDGIRVRLVSPETLYWMKKDTVREKDHADAALLRTKFAIVEDTNKPEGRR